MNSKVLKGQLEPFGGGADMWVWLVTPPLPHLTEDEHPPELAASPVSCQLLLDLLCVTKQEGEDDVDPPPA